MPSDLLGPLGLTVALAAGLVALWRDHLRADADDRAQRDAAITGWREQTAATNRLADALEARARADAKRTRRTDA